MNKLLRSKKNVTHVVDTPERPVSSSNFFSGPTPPPRTVSYPVSLDQTGKSGSADQGNGAPDDAGDRAELEERPIIPLAPQQSTAVASSSLSLAAVEAVLPSLAGAGSGSPSFDLGQQIQSLLDQQLSQDKQDKKLLEAKVSKLQAHTSSLERQLQQAEEDSSMVQLKYSKVKQYYFDRETQVTSLMEELAAMRKEHDRLQLEFDNALTEHKDQYASVVKILKQGFGKEIRALEEKMDRMRTSHDNELYEREAFFRDREVQTSQYNKQLLDEKDKELNLLKGQMRQVLELTKTWKLDET